MIKDNELRKGNLLVTGNLMHLEEIVTVLSIEEVGFRFASKNQQGQDYITLSGYDTSEGIPLTTEILLMCGFEKQYHTGKEYVSPFDRKRLVLIFDDNGPDQINTYWIEDVGMREVSLTFDIMYVHELQNLWFALKMEELDVSLISFKKAKMSV